MPTPCTFGILAHVDAGKTTLSEQILYRAGAIRALGRVDHGDTAHFSDPNLSLGAVAEHFELSESSMSKFFKTHTGVTFSGFIENLRMNHAEKLLLDGDLSVRSIAEAVGYQNTTTFYNAFKRKHSCTPTQWLNLRAAESPYGL